MKMIKDKVLLTIVTLTALGLFSLIFISTKSSVLGMFTTRPTPMAIPEFIIPTDKPADTTIPEIQTPERQLQVSQQIQQSNLVDCIGPLREHFRVTEEACNAAWAAVGRTPQYQAIQIPLPGNKNNGNSYQTGQANTAAPAIQPPPAIQAQPTIAVSNGQYVPQNTKRCYTVMGTGNSESATYCY